ncbi:MAG: alpha-amylase family protein [Pirellulaceae bacterium]
MHRREFLKTGGSATVAGSLVSSLARTGGAAVSSSQSTGTPAVLKRYTSDEHRRRLENIGLGHRAIRTCLRKHLITNYLPAQCGYNLGEYPCRQPWDPGEYDEQELDRLKDHGIQIIQVFDEWNDSLRLHGGDKYTALNPDGFRRFVEMVHRRDMKILTYASTCFLQRTDPDFRQAWAREGDNLVLGYWNMARCSPASPGWRAFLLPRLVKILDTYELDGIYIDGGYVQNFRKPPQPPAADEMSVFPESAEYDAAFTDLLALIYAEVQRRGGILKLHVDAADQPRTAGMKVYDYLWVGEGVTQVDALREAVKNHPPYVVPCIDMTFAKIENADEPYLHAIPYMQFPILQAGRPFTGERGLIPGVSYASEQDFWVRRCREAWTYYQANPSGPYTYGGWDAVPERPATRPTHARWLRQYLPLVEDGTWAWLEVTDSDLFASPLPKPVVASVFANRHLSVVLANYGTDAATVVTADAYVPVDEPAAMATKTWSLPPRSLQILRR